MRARRFAFKSAALVLVAGFVLAADAPRYSYYYKGQLVTMTPSPRLVALAGGGEPFEQLVSERALVEDPLSKKKPLRDRGLRVYRVAGEAAAGRQPALDLLQRLDALAGAPDGEFQPVFEQGASVLIPSNEAIVALRGSPDLSGARALLAPYLKPQGIEDIRPLRPGTFVLTVKDASNGRVYEVCRNLTAVPGVEFAEPNHIVLPTEPLRPAPEAVEKLERRLMGDRPSAPPKPSSRRAVAASGTPLSAALTGWTILVDEGFEGAGLPAGWSSSRSGTQYTDATWSVTNHRSHSGSHSAYATGAGPAGVPPPGVYPDNCNNWLVTPSLDLSSFEEVYVEFWFFGRFGTHSDLAFDAGAVLFHDVVNDTYSFAELNPFMSLLWVGYTGDLTADPTTELGWRHGLLRVPAATRSTDVRIEFRFISDSSDTSEGLYIDDLRVVGATDVDSDPVGNDTYAGRQYELRNTGQIAGHGTDANDLHVPEAWDLVAVDPSIVVAVVDAGVDLAHLDLNLGPGYEPDGSAGGGPRDPHGTSVAGNVGAIRDNALGVVGVAPGVRIMPVFVGWSEAENAQAIDTAAAKGANVITNSWGRVGAPSSAIETAIRDALDGGVIVLFAAGNGPDRPPFTYDVAFPGALTGSSDVITVGASSPTDEFKAAASSDGQFQWGSSYVGPGPDVVAPGPWSYTTDITGAAGYHDGAWLPGDPSAADYMPFFTGTSSSTPKVAGVVALMLSAKPGLTPAQVKATLRDTADDIDAPGVDDRTGAGRVNALRAVRKLLAPRRRALSLHAGGAVPNGSFGTIVNTGFTLNVDFFHPIDANLGWDVRVGYSRFPGASGAGPSQVWDLSWNLKYFLTAPGSVWEPFVNGGVGGYHVASRVEAGYNVGIGVARAVTPDLTIELTYNFHQAVTPSPTVQCGKVQVGLLWLF